MRALTKSIGTILTLFSLVASCGGVEAALVKHSKSPRTTKHSRALKSQGGFIKMGAMTGGSAGDAHGPYLRSGAALIVEETTGRVIYSKNVEAVQPIASITKLMTAIAIVESGVPLDETIKIDEADIDRERNTRSKLRVGEILQRGDVLRLALMASENRAAAALARTYPGGTAAFVPVMNAQAEKLGMTHTHFVDSTGLSAENVSSAEDLVKLVNAASQYPIIRAFSTTAEVTLTQLDTRRQVEYRNTNLLLRHENDWEILLSKTGFINESGQCLVMQAKIAGKTMNIVLLDSTGRLGRIGDANRVRKWLEDNPRVMLGAL